jgi:hypothetical protein
MPSLEPYFDDDAQPLPNRFLRWIEVLRQKFQLIAPLSGLGVWRYRTATAATPAAGHMQFDNVVIASATEMYVNVTTDGGTDISVILATIVSGDLLYVQVRDNADQFITIATGVPALAAGVYTFPITAIVGQGTTGGVKNNTSVIIVTG